MDLLEGFFAWEKQEKIKRFRFLNRCAKKGQILLVGSSLMEQFPIYEFIQDDPIDRVIYNRGVGGITTSDFLEMLEVCVFELQPSKIFINIGANDLNGEDYREEDLIARYRLILNSIQARLPQARLYVMAYYPVNELDDFGNPMAREGFKWRTNRRIADANAQIEALARECRAAYLDVNSGLYDERMQIKKEFSVEGMHMYANGYRTIYERLKPFLLE